MTRYFCILICMCGIAAIIGQNSKKSQEIKNMTNLVSHRGPDGEGFFNDEFVSLGHRRLSIIDLSSGGHQPMKKKDLWITYNGEVFNYLEIKEELVKLGHTFESHSDTEVILASYLQWGKECLHRFNGMFAFVIYDQSKSTVFAARDRFGVKPFYYWNHNEQIYIASEIKQFTKLEGWKASLNEQMAYDFLSHSLLDHTEQTFFEGVQQLRPGHCLRIDLKSKYQVKSQIWYDLKDYVAPSKKRTAIDFAQLLKSAVKLRLRSDVVVGSCLSGGLDSSAIVCLMNERMKTENTSAQQKTFSACSDVKKFDEKQFIDIVVKETKVDAKYTYPDQNHLFKVLEKLLWHQDEPFGSTSIFAQWCVFELARANNVKVMLDGQGADEQLAGYHSYFPIYWVSLLKRFKFLTLFAELKAAKNHHGYSYLKVFKMMTALILPSWMLFFLRGFLSHNSQIFFNFSSHVKKENPLKSLDAFSSMKQASYAQVSKTNLQMLLHWEDRNSMAHGVEARVPFLDYRLVEFTMGLDDEQKIQKGVTKSILREAMKGILPEPIRTRMDKLGFVTPEIVWVQERAPHLFRDALKEAVARSQGLIQPSILEYFEQALTNQKTFDFVIWRAICFGAWLKVFNVKVESRA